jgi:hypothetical protein
VAIDGSGPFRYAFRMILANVFIRPDGKGGEHDFPQAVRENIASFVAHHPGLEHRVFSGNDVEELIEARFTREVLEAYRSLQPLTYKADLARYCIIYHHGGIYADISHYFVRPLPFDGKRAVVFSDLFSGTPWDTNTSVFAAPARHKALERVIAMVCHNVRRQYYGPSHMCPTGPTLFGKAWAMTTEPEEIVAGFSYPVGHKTLSREAPGLALPKQEKIHGLSFDKLVAFKRKQRVGGLSDEWVTSYDDYVRRWKARQVYT